jgi:hypothetical protein
VRERERRERDRERRQRGLPPFKEEQLISKFNLFIEYQVHFGSRKIP